MTEFFQPTRHGDAQDAFYCSEIFIERFMNLCEGQACCITGRISYICVTFVGDAGHPHEHPGGVVPRRDGAIHPGE